MSNKKFMNRFAFVLSVISIVCVSYCLYVVKVNTYKLEAMIVQLEHIQNHIQARIKNNLEANRALHNESTIEGN